MAFAFERRHPCHQLEAEAAATKPVPADGVSSPLNHSVLPSGDYFATDF
ncbi:hypothetical protein SynBIOSE41_01114 [Synechococcus sp. BIOS-E4-1]|nr:hypothetical protein SynBIOSE41_01114 [Synechococcus sp. BIOS-E4-1]